MSSNLIYFRIFGYVATIVLHVTNIYAMGRVMDGKIDENVDPAVKFFADMQYRFYTCWNFFMQIVYAIVALSCDILILKNSRKGYKLPKHLKGARDVIFPAIVWPCTFVVFFVFWGIFYVDRSLILPPIVDDYLTRESNHVIHTAIVPVVLWEVWFQPRFPPKSHLKNLLHLAFHNILYVCVMFYTSVEQGRFIYPIFDKAYGTIYFPVLFLFIAFNLIFMYYLHWTITGLLWGKYDKKKLK